MNSPSDRSAQPPAIANLRALPGSPASRIFRSGALHRLSAAGRQTLAGLDLAAIVDLREPSEIAAAPDDVEAAGPETAVLTIPLYLGPVPLSTPIDQVYRDLLERRRPQLCAVVKTVARFASCGVMFHCKAGKDRTGLVAGLILDAAGVPRDVIAADYARSAAALSAQYRAQVLAMVETAELDEDSAAAARVLHLESPPEALLGALDTLDAAHGSVTEYLRGGGVIAAELEELRAQLNPALASKTVS